MIVSIEDDSLVIEPEDPTDIAWIENTLGLFADGDVALAIRCDVTKHFGDPPSLHSIRIKNGEKYKNEDN